MDVEVEKVGTMMQAKVIMEKLIGRYSSTLESSARLLLSGIFCFALTGCDHPSSKTARIQQVRREVERGGGEGKILKESRTLFSRCSKMNSSSPFLTLENPYFAGLPGITNLGDVFHLNYYPDYFEIRIHNSHVDTYFIALLNPDRPEPAGFERIAGNVGFIERVPPAN